VTVKRRGRKEGWEESAAHLPEWLISVCCIRTGLSRGGGLGSFGLLASGLVVLRDYKSGITFVVVDVVCKIWITAALLDRHFERVCEIDEEKVDFDS
jgi:hypothetical protein